MRTRCAGLCSIAVEEGPAQVLLHRAGGVGNLLVVSTALPGQGSADVDRLVGRQLIAGACAVLWSGMFLLGVAWGILVLALDGLYCERRDSEYGTLGWSLLPPGPTCTFAAETGGVPVRYGPTAVMSVWLLTLFVGGLALWLLARWARLGPLVIERARRTFSVLVGAAGLIALVGGAMPQARALLGVSAVLLLFAVLLWRARMNR